LPPDRTFIAMERIYDLEERLINFTCRMLDVIEALPKTKGAIYMANQLVRSCHSPAFNYSEAQAAESPDDFIHKLRVVLKELKECRTSLKIIIRMLYINPITKLDGIYKETEELIAIIGKSISTSEKKRNKAKDG
jgi:four helix bundle protein